MVFDKMENTDKVNRTKYLLSKMDIPSFRKSKLDKNNLNWLKKNLSRSNSDNKYYNELFELITYLIDNKIYNS